MPPTKTTLRVEGYRETQRALAGAEKETRAINRDSGRQVGEVVREPWSRELERFDDKTAGGLRASVGQRGISVRQSLRKTTGTRPDFGFRQQQIGEQVAEEHEADVERAYEEHLDRIADHFERRP